MKVCTDATLFGAMAPLAGGETVLDIGSGTGLLALMAAQLGAASVTAVELDAAACAEAAGNFARSPWSERLHPVRADVRDWAAQQHARFDLVISNPPFFAGQTRSSDPLRRQARHADLLSLPQLLQAVGQVLTQQGLFHVLLPCERVGELIVEAQAQGLLPLCRTDIRAFAHASPKLSAVCLSRSAETLSERLMTVYHAPREYTRHSAHYLGDFLLRFAQGVSAED